MSKDLGFLSLKNRFGSNKKYRNHEKRLCSQYICDIWIYYFRDGEVLSPVIGFDDGGVSRLKQAFHFGSEVTQNGDKK